MKSKFLINFCLLFSVLLILQSCKDTVKENSENDEKKTEVIEIETKKEQRTTFDPSLDPLKVGEDFSKVYALKQKGNCHMELKLPFLICRVKFEFLHFMVDILSALQKNLFI